MPTVLLYRSELERKHGELISAEISFILKSALKKKNLSSEINLRENVFLVPACLSGSLGGDPV